MTPRAQSKPTPNRTALTGAKPDYEAVKKLPFMKCGRPLCINRGVWGLMVCAPATGTRLFQHTPMTSMLNLCVCDNHIEAVKVDEFLTQELINRMTIYAKETNRVLPDFRRAYIDGVPVDRPEWLEFQDKMVGLKR